MRAGFRLIVFLTVLAVPSTAAAQPGGRLGLVAGIEYAHTTEDDGFLGAGLGGGLGMALHLTRATSVEVEVGWERHRRDFHLHAIAFDDTGRPDGFPYTRRSEGTGTFVLAVVAHAFGAARLRPVVWGGGGLMHHGGTSSILVTTPEIPPGYTLQEGELLTGRGPGGNALVIDGGAGVEAEVTDRILVRPYAGLRLAGTGNVGPKYIIRGGVRIAVRW